MLEVLADPSHEDHADRVEWVGGKLDPEAFDPDEFIVNLDAFRAAKFDD